MSWAGDPVPSPACAAAQASPQGLFGPLFEQVQMLGIFGDSKSFADAVPTETPARILAEFARARPVGPESLQAFVSARFVLPAPAVVPTATAVTVPLRTHIDSLWSLLERTSRVVPPNGSLLPLPEPYVVPGGRFREIYYWDSYFTMLGLADSGRQQLLAGMVHDFAHLIDACGHIPNGTRTYYLSRSQPPFFYAMVGLLSPADPARSYARYLPQLRREYAFWMQGATGLARGHARRRVVRLGNGALLNRYWDDQDRPRDEAYREDVELARSATRAPAALYWDIRAAAESGWDFGSRWFADGAGRGSIDTTAIVPVDLNSLMLGLEQAIRDGCRRRTDTACLRRFSDRVRQRRAAIDRYLWDAQAGVYVDYGWRARRGTGRLSAAMFYPLFVGAASPVQAAAVSHRAILDLLRPGGLVTTPVQTGEQWDAPNGWAPLQWIAVEGLRRYGQGALAATIACRWDWNVQRVYQQTGKLVEKYDVEHPGVGGGGGEYPAQDGFGWTNGVTERLLRLYPEERCPAGESDSRRYNPGGGTPGNRVAGDER